MLSRREFIKNTALAGVACAFAPSEIFSNNHFQSYFGLNPFIEDHPDAVFVMLTNINNKTDAGNIKSAGYELGKSIFIQKNNSNQSFPLDSNITFKPNLTWRGKSQPLPYTIEESMGIVTDCNLVEGLINSLKDIGVTSEKMYIREGNYTYDDLKDGGYIDLAIRSGIDFKDLSAKIGVISESDLQWIDVPEGLWFKKIPYLWPVNSEGSVLINIAKLKTHSMGLSLCAKNLQGTIAANYIRHCTYFGSESSMEMLPGHMNPDANAIILNNYAKHLTRDIPRWDRPDLNGGIWQEIWATRCIDNNLVTRPLINIIEGIYGRDGNFLEGPGPGNLAQDYMTNVIVFGKNPFHVDIIGHWVGGHEPGNFGLFHLAVERGLSLYLNPADIPLFVWNTNGNISPIRLNDLKRTELKTLYLRRDYNNQNEDYWHLVNEPCDYLKFTGVPDSKKIPEVFSLSQNYPNPFNPTTFIAFHIPKNGNVKFEIFDITGKIIDILLNQYQTAGEHLLKWTGNNHSSGLYFYRISYDGYTKTKSMYLLK